MPDGILLIDKPTNMTSFCVVARISRVMSKLNRERCLARGQSLEQIPKRIKVGHAGTLDPFASGLLIVLVGKATKCADSLLKLDKTYEATICLGQRSTTGDPEGEITATPQVTPPTPEEVMQDDEGLQTMRLLGKYMARQIKMNDMVCQSLPLPEEEERLWTNFIR